jgi:DNA-directed RNA polymerase subunit K/omega
MLDTTQVYTEIQGDGTQVLRFRRDRFYDPNSIEGRTGQKIAEVIGGRYDAVLIAANRIRELNRGDAPLIERRYGNRVTAVQEMEQGLVGYEWFARTYKSAVRRERRDK